MTRLLEHYSLDLVAQEGVQVPAYRAVRTPEAAAIAAAEIGGAVIVKALVPAGGRGKLNAVLRAVNSAEAAVGATALPGPAPPDAVPDGETIWDRAGRGGGESVVSPACD